MTIIIVYNDYKKLIASEEDLKTALNDIKDYDASDNSNCYSIKSIIVKP